LCLLPFRKMQFKDKAYVSWVGLRGAVPIIFAIYPLVENVPHAKLIFNIVFFCTLISLIVQGTSLPLIARWLNLAEKPRQIKKIRNFDVDFSDDIKSVMTEIEITAKILEKGNRLMDLSFPDNTLAVMVNREGNYFVPTGQTILKEKDKILIITDNHEALIKTYRNLGIENV
jgi:potassium/hydrogen antiporter